jgi:putative restriction endonuclease
LTASHIVPWRSDTKNRTNPRNGLCLNAIHDKAFDCGLITVTPDYRVRVSNVLKKSSHSGDNIRQSLFLKYEGERIVLPSRFLPDAAFLGYHNVNVFWDARKTR